VQITLAASVHPYLHTCISILYICIAHTISVSLLAYMPYTTYIIYSTIQHNTMHYSTYTIYCTCITTQYNALQYIHYLQYVHYNTIQCITIHTLSTVRALQHNTMHYNTYTTYSTYITTQYNALQYIHNRQYVHYFLSSKIYELHAPGMEFYTMGTASICRGKAKEAWCWPPNASSPEVKEKLELYIYYPSGPSWPVLG
jgi:hypothetical protein